MKRYQKLSLGVLIFLMVFAVFVVAVYAAQTQDQDQPKGMMQDGMMGKGMQGQDMMGKGMMQGGMMGMCPMHSGMMSGMMGRASLTVQGNYLYVLAGNKILKYDPNLKLVRETEIKIDMTKMTKMMNEMMENCPMHKQMMQMMNKPMMNNMMGSGKEESK